MFSSLNAVQEGGGGAGGELARGGLARAAGASSDRGGTGRGRGRGRPVPGRDRVRLLRARGLTWEEVGREMGGISANAAQLLATR